MHAVNGVSWHDAEAYCERVNKQLPTEKEREKAVRGADGRKYSSEDEHLAIRGGAWSDIPMSALMVCSERETIPASSRSPSS